MQMLQQQVAESMMSVEGVIQEQEFVQQYVL